MIEIKEKTVTGKTIRLHDADNVVIARVDLPLGAKIEGGLTCRGQVQAGHKVASHAIKQGEPILKYNVVIGFASVDIPAGSYVHAHNMQFREFDRDYAYAEEYQPLHMVSEAERASFMGIVRANGQVATRNFVGILSTVNCSATVAHKIAEYFTPERLAEYPNIDGVAAFSHDTGCGMEMTGEPMDLLRRTMAGYARHANLAGSLIVGLGCERNQIKGLVKEQKLDASDRLHLFTMQDTGGTRKTIEAGIAAVKEMLPEANKVKRTRVSASHLMIGLQCGGSDGFSSITANPALGAAMDILTQHGGTAILSETPEIYGVEHTLTRRARNREVGEKLIERIRWWEDYARRNNASIDNNPSYGNKQGGLTTIIEKSLGAVAKGGTAPLRDVYQFAEAITSKGFTFMDTPGYDPISVTGLVAGGCQLVVFTTGRGSCFGCKPAPTIKVATNSPLFNRMQEDMDINAGSIIDGETLESAGSRIFEKIVAVASGEQTLSEQQGIGDEEFCPWMPGPVF